MKTSRLYDLLCDHNPVAVRTQARRSRWPAVALAVLLAVVTALRAEPSAAQNTGTGEGYSASIIINTEVLDSLSPEGPVPPLPPQPAVVGSNVVTSTPGYRRSGALLFPPRSDPQSRIVGGTAATRGLPRAARMQSSTATAYSHRATRLIP